MKTTNILGLWISVGVILGYSTCPTLSAEPTALQEVKIGYTSTSTSVFPIEFARRKGFFREEGLNIVMIVMRTNVIMNALLTRGIDYGTPRDLRHQSSRQRLAGESGGSIDGTARLLSRCKKKNSSLSEISKANGLRSALLAPLPTSLFEWCSGKKGWTRSET
jgi:hypothetical protein